MMSNNTWLIILHLNCCFYIIGINSVCFDEESKHITAMKSLEGEVVPFKNKVLLSNNVEVSNSFSSMKIKRINYEHFIKNDLVNS